MAKNKQPIKNQKNAKYQNRSYVGDSLLDLARQGVQFAPLSPSITPLGVVIGACVEKALHFIECFRRCAHCNNARSKSFPATVVKRELPSTNSGIIYFIKGFEGTNTYSWYAGFG